jgi:hypothetical protein
MTSDSGRHAKRGDVKQAPSEGCQSGGEAASPNPSSSEQDALREALAFDEPDAFEGWWQTYKHKNRELANYAIKKCIAFDAFHEALQQARRALTASPKGQDHA